MDSSDAEDGMDNRGICILKDREGWEKVDQEEWAPEEGMDILEASMTKSKSSSS